MTAHRGIATKQIRQNMTVAAMCLVLIATGGGVAAAAPPSAAAPSTSATPTATTPFVADPAQYVDPFLGTSGDGNTWPGATMPFGMMAWSPTGTAGDQTSTPVANGYSYDVNRLRGFSLTHLNGAGCSPGAAGDIPIMPFVGEVTTSPTADSTDATFAAGYSHENESASPGRYSVELDNGVSTDLAVSTRAGVGEFSFPEGSAANLLFRTSNSINGSEQAETSIDAASRTVSGSVLTGGFCGRRGNGGGDTNPNRRSYYQIYFSAVFDRDFASTGTWQDSSITPGGTRATGGEGYLTGADRAGHGSGGWVGFDTANSGDVTMRVGISYVSLAGAEANRDAEIAPAATVEKVASSARAAWNAELSRIRVGGGTPERTTQFYTAVYHSLMQPQTVNDLDGRYLGADLTVHRKERGQEAVYGTFSGWDQYRAQIQLLGILRPDVASDMAQSMLAFAEQNGGVWDRWLHLGAPTHVMTGDPSAATLATWYAMGARDFDARAAFTSLVKQATVQNPDALSDAGCPGQCLGQRPTLNTYLALEYAANDICHCWGGAAETLENSVADFSLAQWADRLPGQGRVGRQLDPRADYWLNTYNPEVGYQAARRADGAWQAGWTPDTGVGFAQGSSAQYTWMVPHDVSGLAEAMGGRDVAATRLDGFFRDEAGNWAVTGGSPLRFDPTNEPDIHTPWMYNALGQPWKTQETVRRVVDEAYTTGPSGLPGNDDLGTMSAWYVFATIGMFPQAPGRAEMLLGSPVFPRIEITRSNGVTMEITADSTQPYLQGVELNGKKSSRSWTPESFITRGGSLDLTLGASPNLGWATAPRDLPKDY